MSVPWLVSRYIGPLVGFLPRSVGVSVACLRLGRSLRPSVDSWFVRLFLSQLVGLSVGWSLLLVFWLGEGWFLRRLVRGWLVGWLVGWLGPSVGQCGSFLLLACFVPHSVGVSVCQCLDEFVSDLAGPLTQLVLGHLII